MRLRLTVLMVAVFLLAQALPAGAYCGNGILDPDEECDTGGYCIGGANAGQHCASEAQCGLSELGVCIGGLKREAACANDAACGVDGTCVRCVAAGNSPIGTTGQTCAANCTIETKIHATLDPASNEVMYSELLGALVLSLLGSQDVLVGKEKNGEIPLAIIASSVHFDPVDVGTIACACVRGVPVQTCGGTLFEADGVTLALDCTDQYTAGASVCTNAHKPPCAYVNGPGNSASGVIGCSGLTGVNLRYSEDSQGRADPAICAFNPPTPPYPVCGAPPVIRLSGSGGPGSAIVINTTATGQFVGGDCSAAPANFCTDSAPIEDRGQLQTLPTVTGQAAGFITNANQTDGDTLCNCNGGAITCAPTDCAGGSPEAGPIAINGSTVSCSQVASGNLSGLGLAGAFTQLSPDIVVTNLQKLENAGTPPPTPTPTPTSVMPLCVGDCSGDGRVTVDEILTEINIALGNTPVSACPGLACPCAAQICVVGVDCILEAVNNALDGCPAPVPTPTASSTPTPLSPTPTNTCTPGPDPAPGCQYEGPTFTATGGPPTPTPTPPPPGICGNVFDSGCFFVCSDELRRYGICENPIDGRYTCAFECHTPTLTPTPIGATVTPVAPCDSCCCPDSTSPVCSADGRCVGCCTNWYGCTDSQCGVSPTPTAPT